MRAPAKTAGLTSAARVGAPVAYDKLTVFPLFLESPARPNYRLAEEALADGSAVVEEVTEGGSVPNLAVDNKGDSLVLFVEGQELRGAKQNRVLNTSVLIAAHTKTVLPVSCVEQGRWRYVSNLVHGSLGAVTPRRFTFETFRVSS